MKYWEIIADNLHKAGWSLGCVSAVDASGRTVWIADAHRDDGKRFVVGWMKSLLRFWNWNQRFVPSLDKNKTNHRAGQPFSCIALR
jgi:hypothetical protein